MASTRNNNTMNDYKLEMRNYIIQDRYAHNVEASAYGPTMTPRLPVGGSAPPSKMSRDCLSGNPIDIESRLFGIGATNLVVPQEKIVPKLKTHPLLAFYERTPLVMPEPLAYNPKERARPIP